MKNSEVNGAKIVTLDISPEKLLGMRTRRKACPTIERKFNKDKCWSKQHALLKAGVLAFFINPRWNDEASFYE